MKRIFLFLATKVCAGNSPMTCRYIHATQLK